ncbi:hypothetical protein JCM10207_006837 [Rhodosporidiobolus poonsookiae]
MLSDGTRELLEGYLIDPTPPPSVPWVEHDPDFDNRPHERQQRQLSQPLPKLVQRTGDGSPRWATLTYRAAAARAAEHDDLHLPLNSLSSASLKCVSDPRPDLRAFLHSYGLETEQGMALYGLLKQNICEVSSAYGRLLDLQAGSGSESIPDLVLVDSQTRRAVLSAELKTLAVLPEPSLAELASLAGVCFSWPVVIDAAAYLARLDQDASVDAQQVLDEMVTQSRAGHVAAVPLRSANQATSKPELVRKDPRLPPGKFLDRQKNNAYLLAPWGLGVEDGALVDASHDANLAKLSSFLFQIHSQLLRLQAEGKADFDETACARMTALLTNASGYAFYTTDDGVGYLSKPHDSLEHAISAMMLSMAEAVLPGSLPLLGDLKPSNLAMELETIRKDQAATGLARDQPAEDVNDADKAVEERQRKRELSDSPGRPLPKQARRERSDGDEGGKPPPSGFAPAPGSTSSKVSTSASSSSSDRSTAPAPSSSAASAPSDRANVEHMRSLLSSSAMFDLGAEHEIWTRVEGISDVDLQPNSDEDGDIDSPHTSLQDFESSDAASPEQQQPAHAERSQPPPHPQTPGGERSPPHTLSPSSTSRLHSTPVSSAPTPPSSLPQPFPAHSRAASAPSPTCARTLSSVAPADPVPATTSNDIPTFSFHKVKDKHKVYYSDELDAFLKIVHSDNDNDSSRTALFELDDEISTYEYLQHKAPGGRVAMGKLFPEVLGVFAADGRYGLLTARLGRALHKNEVIPSAMAASFLADLHGLGLAHGDLKRDNLRIGPNGQLACIDFGRASIFVDIGPKWTTYDKYHDGYAMRRIAKAQSL